MLTKSARLFKKYPPILTHRSPREFLGESALGGVRWLILKSLPYLGVLFLIWLALVISNYTPGTFLTGWDTLHPEFDYSIYVKRVLAGAWQYHQGLGAVASQAHAAELPRLLILRLLDVFVPLHVVRYAFFFSMLLLGPLGVYALLAYIYWLRHDSSAHLWAFIGSLVYLLNLVVLQQFAVPLEMFAVHYGFLGWFFLALLLAYNHFSRKFLALFVIISFFMAPQAHTSTLFVSLFLAVSLFLLVLTILPLFSTEREDASLGLPSFRTRYSRSFILVALLILVNAFWLLPNLYFIFTRASDVRTAHITRLFSQEAFLNNVQYGHIRDVALLKNFLFNWGVYTGGDSFEPLFSAWADHLQSPVVQGIGFGVFALAILGVLFALWFRDSLFLAFSSTFLLSLFFIVNLNPPTGMLYKFFLERVPLFGEAFRFPFTKFSILAIFSYSVMSVYALSLIFNWLWSRLAHPKPLRFAVGLVFTVSLLFYVRPFFTGYLIHPQMRVAIPSRYFELFAFFRGVPSNERIAELPLHTFWGWTYYDWTPDHTGYQGAGFLWFGLKQPLLDREFDRWNLANEQAYRELSYALYSQDLSLFEDVLRKYRVHWLIYDSSVIAPGEEPSVLFHSETQALLEKSPHISLVRDFGGGLRVYFVDTPKSDSVSVSSALQAPKPLSNYADYVYSTFGDYVAYPGKTSLPFAYSIDTKGVLTPAPTMTFDDKLSLSFNSPVSLPNRFRPKTLVLPFEVSLDVSDISSKSYTISLQDVSGVLDHKIYKIPVSLPEGDLYLRIGDSFKHISTRASSMSLGLIYLDVARPSQLIQVYQNVAAVSVLDKLSFEACSDLAGASSYTYSRDADTLIVHASGTGVCATLPFTLALRSLASDGSSPRLDLVAIASDFTVQPDTSAVLRLLNFHTGTFSFPSKCTVSPCVQSLAVPITNVPNYSWRLYMNPKSKLSRLNVSLDAVVAYGYMLLQEDHYVMPLRDISQVIRELDFPVLYSWDFKQFRTFADISPRFCKDGTSVLLDGDHFGLVASGLELSTHSKSLCLSVPLPDTLAARGFILEMRSRFVRGVPLRFCLTNSYSKRCDLYESLSAESGLGISYFVVPPSHQGDSYTLNIQAPVFGATDSVNILQEVSVIPIPYEYLSMLQSLDAPLNFLTPSYVLTNNTAYDPGWIAMCGLRPCDGKHVRLNDWANGWLLDSAGQSVNFVFLPQLGEWLGFVLLPGIFVIIRKLGPK